MDYDYIKNQSGVPYIELDLKFPFDTVMAEILTMPQSLFTVHRSNTSHDWTQFVLYGLTYNETLSPWNDPNNTWTPEARHYMPQTIDWFEKHYPSNYFSKIKVACIKPGGSISEHTDGKEKGFQIGNRSTVNIAVNNPDGAEFHIANTVIPFKPGSAMLIDFGQLHSVVNNSSQDRFHLLVGQNDETDQFKQLVVDGYR